MKTERKWMMALLERIVINAIFGGFNFAGVGMACGLVAGGLTGFLWQGWGGIYPGAFFGGFMRIFSCPAGALIYAVAAARAKPGPPLEPFADLRGRVARGQALGTCSSFVVFEIASAQMRGIPLAKVVSKDSDLFMFVAPALMILGAIAVAILGRADKTATREAN